MNAFGVHGCSAITALTAQNTLGVASTEAVSDAMFRAQLETLTVDLPPAAIKTGMLGSVSICRILADFLDSLPSPRAPLVCDPVLKSTSGADLLDPEALDLLVKRIFPYVTVLTPNLPETEKLIGSRIRTIEDAAGQLLDTGVRSVLIKGGHLDGNVCRDYWTDGCNSFWLASPRVATRDTHGTGCILSAAIASELARGRSLPEAVLNAKTFLNQCLHAPTGLGGGPGPMKIMPFLNDPEHQPARQ